MSRRPTCRVYIGNIPSSVHLKDIEHTFRRYTRRFDVLLKNGFAFIVSANISFYARFKFLLFLLVLDFFTACLFDLDRPLKKSWEVLKTFLKAFFFHYRSLMTTEMQMMQFMIWTEEIFTAQGKIVASVVQQFFRSSLKLKKKDRRGGNY